MQEHPVPQNVTQFEFKLVGDMTIKQFGYVGGGLGLAYLIFTSMATSVPFLAYPLMVICALTGVVLAFLPFQDRMMDHWIKAYFRAIFAPTYAKYYSKILKPDEEAFKKRLKLYTHETVTMGDKVEAPKLGSLAQQAPATQGIVNTAEPAVSPSAALRTGSEPVASSQQVSVEIKSPAFSQQPVAVSPSASLRAGQQKANTGIPNNPPAGGRDDKQEGGQVDQNKTDLNQVVKYAEEAQILQSQILDAEKELEVIKQKASNPSQNAAEVTAEFQQVLTRLETFNNQARVIKDELDRMTSPSGSVEVMRPQQVVHAAPTVKITSEKLEKYSSLSTYPNILNGIVCDLKGNLLSGVIVVTHDKDGLPVRALKTNKLGQFLAATPLTNGVYTLTFEKDDLNFDTIEIELNGSILPAIKINAKGGI